MPPFAKREIKNSFIKLLTERPISQITVKDIVEDCGVNRNFFLLSFSGYPFFIRRDYCRDDCESHRNFAGGIYI